MRVDLPPVVILFFKLELGYLDLQGKLSKLSYIYENKEYYRTEMETINFQTEKQR